MSVLLPSKPIRINTGTSSNNLLLGDTGILLSDGNDSSVSILVDNTVALRADKFRRLGINVDTPLSYRLETSDSEGKHMLMHTPSGPISFEVGSGVLSIVGEGVNLTNRVFIRGSEVFSTAGQINYTRVETAGVAEQNKCLVLDSTKSAYGINTLQMRTLSILESLELNMDSDRFALSISNKTGKCMILKNDEWETSFTLEDNGVLRITSNGSASEIECSGTGIVYPLHIVSNSMTGVGIRLQAYNSINVKRNISSIETVFLTNAPNMENSIIRFNNMNDGDLTNTATIRNDGYIICTTLMELSDARKKNIVNKSCPEASLDKVNKINIYDFTYKSDDKQIVHRGVMAQELMEIIPAAVNVSEEYTISNKEIIGYLIDSVKALTARVRSLESICASGSCT